MYLLIQTKEACPLSITKRTNKVITLLCTLRVLAWIDKCKSSFDLFKAAEKCYNSKEYQEAWNLAKNSTDRNLEIVEGV